MSNEPPNKRDQARQASRDKSEQVGREQADRLEDLETIDAMLKFGGNFVKHLGSAAFSADSENLKKIKQTWPELWNQYEVMAIYDKRKESEAENGATE